MQEHLAEIVWPENPLSANWRINHDLVRFLTEKADRIEWAKESDTYKHMPLSYWLGNVNVEFLPHWGEMVICDLNFKAPDDLTKMSHILALAKEYADLKERMGAAGCRF